MDAWARKAGTKHFRRFLRHDIDCFGYRRCVHHESDFYNFELLSVTKDFSFSRFSRYGAVCFHPMVSSQQYPMQILNLVFPAFKQFNRHLACLLPFLAAALRFSTIGIKVCLSKIEVKSFKTRFWRSSRVPIMPRLSPVLSDEFALLEREFLR